MLTLLSCGQGQASITVIALINAFKERVSADSGLFEAESCLDILLTNLNKI